jgi:hypothetical protein|tara:strand:- start:2843 stop:3358 length:516 start_codon:yes stop_codon:yes gene_type:complete
MELFKIKSNIDEIANALTYQVSLVSTVFSGHIVKNYSLTYKQHLRLLLISSAQQIHLIDRLLFKNNLRCRESIIHRVLIGQARMIAGLWPNLYEEGSLEFFSDKQLEYSQYPEKLKNDNTNYPTGSLLWEFGEEIAFNISMQKNHKIILTTIGTYKFYYFNNDEIMAFIRN